MSCVNDDLEGAPPRGSSLRFLVLVAVVAVVLSAPAAAAAQSGEHTTVTAAGERYHAGPLHRWILGRHYRDVWTLPVEVEYLDLRSLAGGLVPLRRGGGQQTKSLRFEGADGREYTFRSVDKDPSPVLDSRLHDTFVDELVQDGISAAHPYGALVAAPLLEAAGVLHVDPKLVVMPDDPALGEFRADFANVLGLIEERPDENGGERASFAGTVRVISSETLVEDIGAGPDDEVHAEAFLTARMVDLFLGDWDRHRDQWRWAIHSEDTPRRWLPIPRDRDQAFSKFDGAATAIVRTHMPQFVRFDEKYPSPVALHWNAREVDRWFLSGLDRAEWDAIGAELVTRLTDEVIAEATRRLPPEVYALDGGELESTLRARRDGLPGAWRSLYALLAREVDIQGTRADEVVLVDRGEPGAVTISTRGQDGRETFRRRFLTAETAEIRLYLDRGDDDLSVRGDAETGITVRVMGGRGDDRFRVESSADGLRLYDDRGDNTVVGDGAPSIDERPWEEWEWTEEDRGQPRDWGHRYLPLFWSGYSAAVGPVIGGGIRRDTYAFRKSPNSSTVNVRLGYAPVLGKGRGNIDARFNLENSSTFWAFGGDVSRLEVTHFYGLGNATGSAGREFHEVDQTGLRGWVGLGASFDERVTVSARVFLERVSTQENTDRFIQTLGPIYGDGAFVQSGATASVLVDPWRDDVASGNRFRLRVEGTVYPSLLDVTSVTADLGAQASLLLASGPSSRLSLALRAGAEQIWGRFPWHHASFLGGPETLRGWDDQRFAGDRSVFGSGELRLMIWQPRIVIPSALGVFGFGDGGRVFVNGDSSGGWHTSWGGGIWLHPILQPYLLRVGVGVTEPATQLFFMLGLPY